MFRLHVPLAVLLTVTFTAAAQTTLPQAVAPVTQPQPVAKPDNQKLVAEQFGPSFNLLDGFAALTGDVDGDGAEDLVMVATGKNPLLDETDYHYATIDPYNTFFGFGDPAVTMRFVAQDGPPRYLLIVQGWRQAKPKAKFVVINLPFEKVEVVRVRIKKKTIPGIGLEDRTGGTSDLYWTGKQWKWVDSNLKTD